MNGIDSYSGTPTARQIADTQVISVSLAEGLAEVKRLTDEDLPRLNKMMAEAGVPYVTVDLARPQGQSRGAR